MGFLSFVATPDACDKTARPTSDTIHGSRFHHTQSNINTHESRIMNTNRQHNH